MAQALECRLGWWCPGGQELELELELELEQVAAAATHQGCFYRNDGR
jgi:hypothetical protein